jgi:hypothetical protein
MIVQAKERAVPNGHNVVRRVTMQKAPIENVDRGVFNAGELAVHERAVFELGFLRLGVFGLHRDGIETFAVLQKRLHLVRAEFRTARTRRSRREPAQEYAIHIPSFFSITFNRALSAAISPSFSFTS